MILPLQEQFDLLIAMKFAGGRHALTSEQYDLLRFFYFSGGRAVFTTTVADPEGQQQTDKEVLEAVRQLVEDFETYFASRKLPSPCSLSNQS